MTDYVPIVDISTMDQTAADKLVEAAHTVGFVFIEGSDFNAKDVDDMFEISKQYFELPEDEKLKFPIGTDNMGYSKMGLEVLNPEDQKKGDPKEAFNFGQFHNGVPAKQLPPFFEERLDKLVAFESKCKQLTSKLLKLVGKGLQIDTQAGGDEWFVQRHANEENDTASILRFLYYHGQKSAAPEEVIRAGAHTDYGSLTLLFQKEGEDGLEIYSGTDKEWKPVKFYPAKDANSCPPIIINIADILSFWTAGYLKSSLHRVKFPKHLQETGKDRYAMVYFCHPVSDVLLEPVPSPIISSIEGRGANAAKSKNKVLTAKEHLDNRLAATYGWKGDSKETSIKSTDVAPSEVAV